MGISSFNFSPSGRWESQDLEPPVAAPRNREGPQQTATDESQNSTKFLTPLQDDSQEFFASEFKYQKAPATVPGQFNGRPTEKTVSKPEAPRPDASPSQSIRVHVTRGNNYSRAQPFNLDELGLFSRLGEPHVPHTESSTSQYFPSHQRESQIEVRVGRLARAGDGEAGVSGSDNGSDGSHTLRTSSSLAPRENTGQHDSVVSPRSPEEPQSKVRPSRAGALPGLQQGPEEQWPGTPPRPTTTPPGHIVKSHELHRNDQDLMSSCGDLTKLTPKPANIHALRMSKCRPGSGEGHLDRRDRRSESATSCFRCPSQINRQRSDSRASNISKKRHTRTRRRSPTQPERTTLDVAQIAHAFNQYIEAGQERDAALAALEETRDELAQAQHALKSRATELSDQVRKTESLQRHLSRKDQSLGQTSSEKDLLREEVAKVRTQLSESHKHQEAMRKRLSTFRSRLNAAIDEQQDLYRRNRAQVETLRTALREEEERRIAQTEAVERAVEDGENWRRELQSRIQELRRQEAAQKQESKFFSSQSPFILTDVDEETISTLREQIKDKEAALVHEKLTSESFRARIETSESNQRGFESLELKLDQALRCWVENGKSSQEQADLQQKLDERLEAVSEQISIFKECTISREDINSLYEKMEGHITEGLTNAGEMVLKAQQTTHQLVSDLNVSVEQGFGDVRNHFGRQRQDWKEIREQDGEAISQIFSVLNGLGKQQDEMRKGIESSFEALDEAEKTRVEEGTRFREELTRQLEARDGTISKVHCELRIFSDEFRDKLQNLLQSANENRGTVSESLGKLATDLGNRLDQGLKQQEPIFQQKLRDSEQQCQHLKNELVAAGKELAARYPIHRRDLQALAKSVQDDKSTVSRLKAKILAMEKEAEYASQLRSKWEADVVEMRKLRVEISRLRAVQNATREGKSEKMKKMTSAIRDSSQYLAAESAWSRDQLAARGHPQTERQPATLGDGHSTIQKALSQRRVKITSFPPHSPSPAPSVNTEQLRRRDAEQPRPILKTTRVARTNPSTQRQGYAPGDGTQFYSRATNDPYNRPVRGEATSQGRSADPVQEAGIRQRFFGASSANQSGLSSLQPFERSNGLPQSSQPMTGKEVRTASKRAHSPPPMFLGQGREKIPRREVKSEPSP